MYDKGTLCSLTSSALALLWIDISWWGEHLIIIIIVPAIEIQRVFKKKPSRVVFDVVQGDITHFVEMREFFAFGKMRIVLIFSHILK